MPLPPHPRLIAAAGIVLAWLLLCLWAWRQARMRAASQARALRALDAPPGPQTVLVAYASQTGFAAELAEHTAAALASGGLQARVAKLGQLDTATLGHYARALFIASTYGEGDPPDAAAAFADTAMQSAAGLGALRYAVLALGDSSYAHFCGFGHRLDDWLRANGATPLFDLVEVDAGDAAALRHWQHHLGLVTGCTDLPDWQAPAYQAWRLARRTLLNPGSQGGPCYFIELTPPHGMAPQWQAGDIAEIGPRDAPDSPLHAHREYSIASLPADGAVHLLVRQMRAADGALGLGSGWLTHTAQAGQRIDLRVRANRNFHPPADARPLILVGNGTGLAGLRALIKARRGAGHGRNWLVFGERNAAHDWFCRDELEQWRGEGWLEHVDAVFSRDTPQRRYVQDLLRERAERVRDWISEGAAVYVCGSLHGMAEGVHQALADILGPAQLQALQHAGRYRRDVY
ncbi:sulfite reductase subunit alpha [Bordetella genomosp. 6]|uniref:sulfite reductase subunit alpha n=1 Tax=Bordetella genomosp. 6 TaxID=463024 RepID=UPI000A296A2E|nr:sulfite reductase subunit alpha [Bordetella genomosp. 6]ARP76088.1 oxidoreductase [Bordetella genomosp. 6]